MASQFTNFLFQILQLPRNWHDRRSFAKSIARCVSSDRPIKIVIGSGGIFDEGWIPSDSNTLDLLKEEDWLRYFDKNQIHGLFAEHVWEHLTLAEAKIAVNLCYKYLASGGYLRIAVPDGLHSDQEYIRHVEPNGIGPGADDHKVLYDYISLSEILRSAGFDVELVEYFDESGAFHTSKWEDERGRVRRSLKYDSRNVHGKLKYTSLIIDAIKPNINKV